MTLALCLRCGATKFGAMCPCADCGADATGNPRLDIAFSDHVMNEKTIEQFGKVVASIRKEAPEQDLAFWAFIKHVSDYYPKVLQADLPPELSSQVNELLGQLDLPPVTLLPGYQRAEPVSPNGDVESEKPGYVIPVPTNILTAYCREHPFTYATPVDVLTSNGECHRGGVLVGSNAEAEIIGSGSARFDSTDIVALRTPKGCLSFRQQPWVRPSS